MPSYDQGQPDAVHHHAVVLISSSSSARQLEALQLVQRLAHHVLICSYVPIAIGIVLLDSAFSISFEFYFILMQAEHCGPERAPLHARLPMSPRASICPHEAGRRLFVNIPEVAGETDGGDGGRG